MIRVVGGYCPGTSLVAAASGRWDGLFFLLGLVAGTWIFAGGYDFLKAFLEAAAIPSRRTLPQLTGWPPWTILLLLAAAATAGFLYGTRMEQKSGGPIGADETGPG